MNAAKYLVDLLERIQAVVESHVVVLSGIHHGLIGCEADELLGRSKMRMPRRFSLFRHVPDGDGTAHKHGYYDQIAFHTLEFGSSEEEAPVTKVRASRFTSVNSVYTG